jgi:hypothetical protein
MGTSAAGAISAFNGLFNTDVTLLMHLAAVVDSNVMLVQESNRPIKL